MKSTDIKFFYTGALSDGGNNDNPILSLGNFRALTEVVNKKNATAPVNITGVVIDFASVANTNTAGTLTYTIDSLGSALQWMANGDSIGDPVFFTVDATKLIYSNDESKFIQVTVTFASLPVADDTDSITVSENEGTLNNIFEDVNSAKVVDGFIEHRALIIKNTHASEPIYTPQIYISLNTASTDDSIEFAFEEPSTRTAGFIQTILEENALPIDIGTLVNGASVWNRVTTKPTAISLPGVKRILAGDLVGIWFRRKVNANAAKFANNIFNITLFGEVASLEN